MSQEIKFYQSYQYNTVRQAKIRIPAKTLDSYVGQKVNINLLLFRESEYGSLNGIVEKISGSTVKNEPSDDYYSDNYYYESIVSIEQQYLQTSKRQMPLQVGMPLVAEIKTSRDLYSAFYWSLLRVARNAFEE